VAGVCQTLRMEYYGSGTSLGVKTVKFFINGALVATINDSNVYGAGTMNFQMSNTTTLAGPITQVTTTCGPLLATYNMTQTPTVA
jgi:hypothetical protein